MRDKGLTKLQEEIEYKRNHLNNIIIEEIDKFEIMKISKELDVLITEYIHQTI